MKKKEIEKFKHHFGKNLQNIRKSKNLSLLQLSYRCDIDNSNISKIEHGRFDIRLSTLLELSKGLDIDLKELFNFEFDLHSE